MAGNKQSKKASQQKERLASNMAQAQGSSRVSKAAGSVSPNSSKGTQMEQRSNVPSSRSTPNPKNQPSTKRKQGANGGQGRNGNQGTRKATIPNDPAPGSSTRDTRFISWLRRTWNNLEPHHQQRFLGTILLLLSLLLFASLTFFRNAPILSQLSKVSFDFFGWSAYLLALGLIAFAIAHLVEGIRNARFIRMSFVVGLIVLWLIVLLESQLILRGRGGAGILAELLFIPLQGWPAPIEHVLLIGLFILVAILTFRITFGHVLMLGYAVKRLTGDRQQVTTGRTGNTGPSQYRGQRPRYSRYASGLATNDANSANGNAPAQRGPGQVQAPAGRNVNPNIHLNADELDDEDEDSIVFEPDFDLDEEDDDDPLNDINLHKQHVSRIPRGPRQPQPIDLAEHKAAVQGAQQHTLPFNAAQAQQPQAQQQIEPLAPNPWHNKSIITPRIPAPESPWNIPDTTMLNRPEEVKLQILGDDTATLAKLIQDTLRSFKVDAEVKHEDISIGPTVIRFGIRPTGKPEMKIDEKSGKYVPVRDAGGGIVYETRTRVSRIMALQNDLALVLEAKAIRMEAPVPGRPYVGVEIPNKNSRLVTLREVLESKEYVAAKAKSKLAIALGKDVAGQVRVSDLTRMPHLLIAGATGAGKSVCLNTIIASILTQASPDDVRLLLVDPKMVELNMYGGIPHLLSPVVTEVEKVVPLLRNAITEMERRYRLFSQLGVRNLDGYRKLRAEKLAHNDYSLKNLPAIVIIIDELADLMMLAPEEVEGMICRLAQLARATGIHLVIATQRPSVDVITGLIKANIPTRISFMVSSAVDSRTIIDMGGAERLLGRGDMLYLPADAGRPERIQGCFLADEEAEQLVAYWRQQVLVHTTQSSAQSGVIPNPANPAAIQNVVEPGWEIKEQISDDFELDDDLLDKAEEVVREYEKASISLLQRRLRIGYSRAARLIDLLEERGIIGPSESGGRSREVLEGNGNNGSNGRNGGNGSEGRTMADEAADIIAEEKAREEFLRKQNQANNNVEGM